MITLESRSYFNGAEAHAFGSFAVTLLDDESMMVPLPVDFGHVFVAESSATTHGLAWVRGSSAVKYAGGANFNVVANTVLSGTTGTDGSITLSTNSSNLYLENRSGATVNLSITVLGISKTRI